MCYNSNRIGNDVCSEENETRMGELHHEVTYMERSDDEKEELSPVSLRKNIPGRGRGKACNRNRFGGRGKRGGESRELPKALWKSLRGLERSSDSI